MHGCTSADCSIKAELPSRRCPGGVIEVVVAARRFWRWGGGGVDNDAGPCQVPHILIRLGEPWEEKRRTV